MDAASGTWVRKVGVVYQYSQKRSSTVSVSTSTLEDMPEWRETTEQIDWLAKQPSQVACFSEDLKCWEAWDITCGPKANDITPSTGWRREAGKEEVLNDLPWKDERGPSSIRRTFELFQRQRCGNFWETGWSPYGLFRAHRYHLELNWTELHCICSVFHFYFTCKLTRTAQLNIKKKIEKLNPQGHFSYCRLWV